MHINSGSPLNKKMAWSKELYQWYKEKGICVQCGSYKSAPGRVRCECCLAKNAESSSKQRKKRGVEERKKDNENHRIAREKRKQKGLCINCGKPQSKSSKCFCIDCRIKNQRKNDRRKNGISRSERYSYGLCYICGGKLDADGRLCSVCKTRSTENLPKESKKNSYWRKDNKIIFKN